MIEQAQTLSLVAMLGIGLAGSGHCIGMCGGIATGLGFAGEGKNQAGLILGYNCGRIFSYAVAGGLVATLGYWGSTYLALGPVLRIAAGLILVMMGLYLANWWRILTRLESAGSFLWRYLQPLGKNLLPVRSFSRALALGALWGWLPCGLVYTALAYAATSAKAVDGALLMASFGLGTAPAMVAGGLFSGSLKKFMQGKAFRVTMALVMIVFGCWTLVTSATHLAHLFAPAAENTGHHHHG